MVASWRRRPRVSLAQRSGHTTIPNPSSIEEEGSRTYCWRRSKGAAMAKQIEYAIMVEPLGAADGGGWLATVPALPGCMGDGETREDALADAESAIIDWQDAARQLGRDVPSPASLGQWRQRVPRSRMRNSRSEPLRKACRSMPWWRAFWPRRWESGRVRWRLPNPPARPAR